jgi:hypothetical protein
MAGPLGVRIAVALSAAASAATWLVALTVIGMWLEVPLPPGLPHAGAPYVGEPSSSPPEKPAPAKAKEKLIEISPWEQIPA